jgi:hypothetical protein
MRQPAGDCVVLAAITLLDVARVISAGPAADVKLRSSFFDVGSNQA